MLFEEIQPGSSMPLNIVFFNCYGQRLTQRCHYVLQLRLPVSNQIMDRTGSFFHLGFEAYWDQFWHPKLMPVFFGAGRKGFWLAIWHTCLHFARFVVLIGFAVCADIFNQISQARDNSTVELA